jgi:hypothetical protein
MKKTTIYVIAIIAGLIVSSSAKAQDFDRKSLITFEQFKEKVSGVSVPGFSGRPQIENEEDEGIFQAAFLKGNDMFLIKIEARHYSPGWTASPYKLDGKNAEFGLMAQLAMLLVDLPETYSVLTLVSNKIKDKATLEGVALETGFLQMAAESAGWPSHIPADYRLKGALLEATEGKDYDAGFSYQVRAKLIMSDQLKQSLLQLVNTYEDEGDFLRFPNGIILNYPFSDIESMDEMYNEHDVITFTYYIP